MNRIWKIAVVSQILALLTHLYLVSTHYKLKLGLMDGKSLCNISDFFNCDVVNSSSFSMFFGIPIALLGFCANAFLLVALLAASAAESRPRWLRTAQITSIAIALTSVIMGAISSLLLKSICLFCFAVYIFSFITFYCVQKLSKSEGIVPLTAALKTLVVGGVVVVAVSFLGNNIIMHNLAAGLDTAIISSMSDWKSGTDVDLSGATGLTKGSDRANAKMVIVEFADFQCIHCKEASSQLKNFVQSHKDVTLVFQSFPLDGLCNSVIQRQGDGKSCDLAKAVYCGNQQNKGWELHDWIFENFHAVDLSRLTEFAEQQGVNIEEWRKCRDSEETITIIKAQAKLGETSGVQGTPAIFVNGRLLPRGSVFPVLEAAYQELK